MAVKSKHSSRGTHNKTLIVISLILVVVLVSSLAVYVLVVDNTGGSIHVKSEVELRRAIDDVKFGESATIILDRDIALIGTLIIPVGKDITLKSNGGAEFFRLLGPADNAVLGVEGGGVLRLDGIIVTHENGVYGSGVGVGTGATLILYDGEISNNNVATDRYNGGIGGGVSNAGIFEMFGGVISGNIGSSGGGVCNSGTFNMFGGTISGNIAVYPYRVNSHGPGGGGIYNWGSISMSGGIISGNMADSCGGGVYLNGGSFEMYGGVISGNTAMNAGGVYHNWGAFNVSGGEISGNTADLNKDVYNYNLP
ncbi:MAG: hypothetical protein FWD52_03405 [Candidatus Bathyarchaeota archaeon]|nr:hypothetical protein [Candidatus Termiticorpusculum sp.]